MFQQKNQQELSNYQIFSHQIDVKLESLIKNTRILLPLVL